MHNDLLFQIALTQVPNVGDVVTKILVGVFGSAEAIFRAPIHQLEKIEGIGTLRAHSIKKFNNFVDAENELVFIEKAKIQPLFLTDEVYPKRLLNCYDNPALLYYRGTADLNQSKIISVVGTRANSDYGRAVCEKMIEELAAENVLIVSGLAFGIDTIAHKAALKNNLETIAVVAHGLDRIYPSQNTSLAKQMVSHGGLLTDFKSKTLPDRHNFPSRNRIVAGMCDALLVVESGVKGGSLITAELANGYNKDVFAIPGKTTDAKSEGCNFLVKNNKANLVTSAADILEFMNWKPAIKKDKKMQRALFIEMTADEKVIVEILQRKEQVHIDELFLSSKLSSSAVAAALLMLEMQNVVSSLPGKMYQLL